MVLLDDQGQVLRPAKLWCDTETAPENERLLAHLGGERQRIAGTPRRGDCTGLHRVQAALDPRAAPPGVRAHRPYPAAHDYLNYWLTGRAVAEYGDASGTGYFNVRSRRWDTALLQHIDPSGRPQRRRA